MEETIEKKQTNTGKMVEKPSASSSGVKGKVKRPKKNRLPFELPKLGDPGGKDDPLRLGLSGAGVRKYLRFLHQGFEPEEARKLAAQRPTLEITPSETSETQNKRGLEHVALPTPPPPPKKQMISAEKVIDYAAAVKTEKSSRVAIMPKDYPKATLQAEQLNTLEDILVEEMCQSKERGIHFAGIHYKNGMMLVDCGSQKSADWIAKSVQPLNSWKGPQLVVRRGDDIPKTTKITVFFPRSLEMGSEKILRLVEVQNSSFNTTAWRILNSKKEGTGTILLIEIDPQSAEALQAEGCYLNFRFGRIPVSGLRRNAPSVGSVDIEIPSTSQRPEMQNTEECSGTAMSSQRP